jgi:SAM-dependent methyltransferase
MRACADCGFVFNQSFDASLLSYGVDYDNTQDCSPVFDQYLDELVRYMVTERGVHDCRIIEVGCGKGGFLRKLVSYPDANNTGVGFDPSYRGPELDLGGRIRFFAEPYERWVKEPGDAVVCRHVIEHIARPLELLAAVRKAIGDQRHSKVFFETPSVEWILSGRVFWDFFYEHCSLFTGQSLATAFELAAFKVVSSQHLFHGQYQLIEAEPASLPGLARPHKADVLRQAREYAAAEAALLGRWKVEITRRARKGKVCLWGAAAKGVTFANLIDPHCELLDAVVDLNPRKQGRFIPGSGHPIVDYRDLAKRGITDIVLMNPNYRQENTALLEAIGIPANFVELK